VRNPANLFKDIPADLPEELVEVLASNAGVTVERIVSRGHASPPGTWYDQETEEWVVLLEGRAAVLFAGGEEPTELGPGDYLHIPAHCRHRVEWTAPEAETVWLAVHWRQR
jgi:cupin 2 domain-containing protein